MARAMGADGGRARRVRRRSRRVASALRRFADVVAVGRAAGLAWRGHRPTGVALQFAIMNLLFAVLMAAAPPPQVYHVLSQTYVIDKKYRSMEGPAGVQTIRLGDPNKPPELLWITGVRTEMVTEDGTTPQLPELMCHLNVDLDPAFHQALFDVRRPVGSRLITLSQGMLSAKVPDGFGFPITSNEPLLLFTQVLNLNIEKPNHLKVRHRVTIDYVRDRDLTQPIKPLFNVGASGTVLLDNNPLALASMATSPDAAATGAAHNGTSCLIGTRA